MLLLLSVPANEKMQKIVRLMNPVQKMLANSLINVQSTRFSTYWPASHQYFGPLLGTPSSDQYLVLPTSLVSEEGLLI